MGCFSFIKVYPLSKPSLGDEQKFHIYILFFLKGTALCHKPSSKEISILDINQPPTIIQANSMKQASNSHENGKTS
jgi:hypothetical protein